MRVAAVVVAPLVNDSPHATHAKDDVAARPSTRILDLDHVVLSGGMSVMDFGSMRWMCSPLQPRVIREVTGQGQWY